MKIEVIGPRTGKYTGNLLSAAPELLAALRALVAQIDEDMPEQIMTRHFQDALEDARHVISKATGESK